MRPDERLHAQVDHTLSSLGIRGLKGEAAAPRYLLWKLWHSHLPLASTSSWDVILEKERAAYVCARQDALRAPDGSLPPELDADPVLNDAATTSSTLSRTPSSSGIKVDNLQVNNPLSLESSNPWPEHFASLDTLQTIQNDVERAFPDFETDSTQGDDGVQSGFFKQSRVAQGLTRILFVWAKQNDDIGYRQGMHEIAGAIWLARERNAAVTEAQAPEQGLDILSKFSDARYIEQDTFTIFEELMRTHRQCFEWRSPPSPAPTQGPEGQPPKPAQSAMIQRCEQVQELIHKVDPALGSKLDELEIEPQLWAMRWIRMLFLREFDLDTAMRLWDGIFLADASTLELLDFLCLAMLLRIRGKLSSADNSAALQLLLRFPTDQVVPTDKPQAVDLLLTQARRLQASPNPATGVQIVLQNRDELGIPIELPTMTPAQPDPPRLRTSAATSAATGTNGRPSEARTVSGARPERRRSALPDRGAGYGPTSPTSSSSPSGTFASFLPTGVSEAAKGLYERSESLGLNRALAQTVTNVQRTVNAYAQQGVRSGGAVGSDGFPRGFDALMPTARAAREQDQAGLAQALSDGVLGQEGGSAGTGTTRPSATPRAFQRFEPTSRPGPLPAATRSADQPGSAPPEPMVPSYATYTRSKGRAASSMTSRPAGASTPSGAPPDAKAASTAEAVEARKALPSSPTPPATDPLGAL